jgi:hypothetical protein
MNKKLAALIAAIALAAPLAANAQDVPSYADQGSQDLQIRGRVINFDGGYNLQVRDDNGYVDNVQLHDGTIINPTGLSLAPNMVVSILGTNAGNVFEANEIDTPYTYDAGVPYYEGHPWDYYGPSFGLSFFFGSGGWWHGPGWGGVGFRGYAPFHGGGYRTGYYNGGNRSFNNVHVNNTVNNYHGNGYARPGNTDGYTRPAVGSTRALQYSAPHTGFQPGGAVRTQQQFHGSVGAPRATGVSHASAPRGGGGGGGEHRR